MWPDAHQPFAGEVDADGSWFAWRLTSGNHRELGRSSRVFADLTTVTAAAALVSRQVDSAELEIVTVSSTGTWWWRLRLDGELVATSSRGYARHRECAYNASTFRVAAAVACIADHEHCRIGPHRAGDGA
jgi:uncharacterized protein YegP (UPF0339 family)